MHLLILGLILVVGILVYYIMTSSSGNGKSLDGKKDKIKRHNNGDDTESHVPDDLRKEGNVVFLPTANQNAPDSEVDSEPDDDPESDPDQNA